MRGDGAADTASPWHLLLASGRGMALSYEERENPRRAAQEYPGRRVRFHMAAIITLSCPSCKQQIRAPAEARGKRVKCKACGAIFAIPAAEAKTKPAAPPAKAAAPANVPPK